MKLRAIHELAFVAENLNRALGRAGQVSVFNKELNKGDLPGTVVTVVKKTVLSFFTAGDLNWRQNVSVFPSSFLAGSNNSAMISSVMTRAVARSAKGLAVPSRPRSLRAQVPDPAALRAKFSEVPPLENAS